MNFDLKIRNIEIKTFLLIGEIKNDKILINLKNFIKNNTEISLNSKTHVKGDFTGFYKLLDNQYFLDFLNCIKNEMKIVYPSNFFVKEAWGNVCVLNGQITEHNHKGINAFCGILYLTEGGPGTYFKEYDLNVEEKIGRFILFHPYLLHSVKKIENNIERITMAFNMQEITNWDLEKFKNSNNKIIEF